MSEINSCKQLAGELIEIWPELTEISTLDFVIWPEDRHDLINWFGQERTSYRFENALTVHLDTFYSLPHRGEKGKTTLSTPCEYHHVLYEIWVWTVTHMPPVSLFCWHSDCKYSTRGVLALMAYVHSMVNTLSPQLILSVWCVWVSRSILNY